MFSNGVEQESSWFKNFFTHENIELLRVYWIKTSLRAGYILKFGSRFLFRKIIKLMKIIKKIGYAVGFSYERSVLDIKGMNVNAGDPQSHFYRSIRKESPFGPKPSLTSEQINSKSIYYVRQWNIHVYYILGYNNNDDRFQIHQNKKRQDNITIIIPIIIVGSYRYPNLDI